MGALETIQIRRRNLAARLENEHLAMDEAENKIVLKNKK